MLSDNSVGIKYNDLSNILLHADGEKIQYLDKNFHETLCSVENYPSKIKEMVSQVDHCRKLMNNNIIEAQQSMSSCGLRHLMLTSAQIGSSAVLNRGDDISRLPILQRWFKSGRAIFFWLSDECMQINWFEVSHNS